jgi:phosphoglycolate phosphatase-like HAD superfamily hydrolase
MPENRRRLVLFDIDGTLISTGGRAAAALGGALEDTFGRPVPWSSFRYSGKTDPQIVFELMAQAGIERPDVETRLSEVFEHYLSRLEGALARDAVRVLPGVRSLLDRLVNEPGVRLGLLTGNLQAGAAVKLRAAGLDDCFEVGAFGSDDERRDHLVPIARDRALARWGEAFPGTRTVVVGDAEPDVRCARAGGARAVAVATGGTSLAALQALRPDALLDSLEPDRALPAILAAGETVPPLG